jgi:hypothetical protein
LSTAWRRKLTSALTQWMGVPAPVLDELARARSLIAAIDAGGVPLHPGKVNQIARGLGLEVSTKAPMEDTIARIRQALARASTG